MNAPFAWPTKSPLPKFRTNRVVITGLGILLASCSDGLTQPGERSSTPATQPGIVAARFATPDVVVMERTTTDASRNGETPETHSSREVLTATTRLALHGTDVRALPAASSAAPKALPRPPISLPARQELAMCSALPSWTERTKGANGRGVILSGVGDAPASSIKIVQDDGSVWTVDRHWTRTARSWQLDRQETRGTRGYRDVVTYRHQNAEGQPVDNAIAVRGCAAQEPLTGQPSAAASRNYYAPYSSALYSKLVPGSGILADDACWEDGDPCYSKRLAVYRDDVALVTAATAMTLACITPVNVTVVVCVGTINAYAAAVAYLAIDQAAYQQCLADAAAAPKQSGGELSIGRSAPILANPASNVSRSVTGIGATRLNDCSGGGDNSATSNHCHWDTYEISYDHGETWVPFATFLICDDAT